MLLSAFGPALASAFELLVALALNDVLAPGEDVGRRHVAEGAVQAHRIVVLDEPGDDPLGFLAGARGGRPHAVGFEGTVVALELAVGLRIKGGGAHMAQARQADEVLEIPGDELRPVIRDDPQP